jgi:hypothetical protein
MTKPKICIQFCFYTSLFFLLFFSHATSQLNDLEQAILLKLKQHWQNPQSLSHWTPSNTSHCSWPEIFCTNGFITELSLTDKNINGTVPPFICDLKTLTVLDLSYNYMTSSGFPRALYSCSNLQYLDLSQNYFSGTVPQDIPSASSHPYIALLCCSPPLGLWQRDSGVGFFGLSDTGFDSADDAETVDRKEHAETVDRRCLDSGSPTMTFWLKRRRRIRISLPQSQWRILITMTWTADRQAVELSRIDVGRS